MGRIPEQVVAEIRERADIVSFVGRYVTLRKSGSRFWGLCPFHGEKTASFQVNEDKQIFYCFGCGAGGDVFAFRMRQEGLDFPDAVRALARELGIAIPEGRAGESQTHAAYRANDAACAFFRAELRGPNGAVGRRYLAERGVPEDLIERFQIGFAPAGWDGLVSHLRRASVPVADAEAAGLVARRQTGDGHYDRFRARVVFPITDPSGQIAGFGGRAMGDDTPKYLNSPESAVYKKSRVLFGLAQALDAIRSSGRVIVVEGYFDLLALHRAGLHEAVAPCGTAVTQSHAHRIRRYAEEVVLLFDGDAAGQAAAERALPILLAEGLRVRAAFLPLGDDPDTLLAKSGVAALRACVDSAVPLLDHLIERVLKDTAAHAWAAADAAKSLAPYLRAIGDPVERAAYVRQLSSQLEIPPSALDEALRQGDKTQHSASPVTSARAGGDAATRRAARELDPAVRGLVAALAAHPDLVPLFDELDPAWLAPGLGRDLLLRLLDASRESGRGAVAALLAHGDEPLPEDERALLLELSAEAGLDDERSARRAVSDCLAKLGIGALDRQKRALEARLGSCTEPAQIAAVTEEIQQIASRRHDLQKRRTQV
ncbi:MAG TPA: DNA primase [Myxococcota bacterium]|nr:DNA primase [Myxococcota bacterium]